DPEPAADLRRDRVPDHRCDRYAVDLEPVRRLGHLDKTRGSPGGASRRSFWAVRLLVRRRVRRVQPGSLADRPLLAVVEAEGRSAAALGRADVPGPAILLARAPGGCVAEGVLHARADRCALGTKLAVVDRPAVADVEHGVRVVTARLRLVAADALEAGAAARGVRRLLANGGSRPTGHERCQGACQA